MRPIIVITALAAAAALATALLPRPLRVPAWSAEAVLFLAICTWGTVSMRSGIFAHALIRGHEATRHVFLTYDDGPDPRTTPVLLDVLKARNVRAAFFLVGSRARAYPALVRRIHENGHVLGNHSYHHRAFTNFLFGPWLERELAACQKAITDACGVVPRHYRPPFGLMNHAVHGVTRKLALTPVGWDTRSLDGGQSTVRDVVDRTLRKARPGGIILLHDGPRDPNRVAAITTQVLDGLEARGMTPARLDQLSIDLEPGDPRG